jgi:hypothetical protein
MPDAFYAGIAAAVIASIGLWWFRLVLPSLRRHAKTTRYGVYVLVWLAYFILTLIVIGQQG